jgi:hypothetical protein
MAAGLGFKTFTTGEVLTAGDVNGYLMQGVLVFADAAARTAAITSPQEGQVSFLKDTNSTEYYSGSAWVAVGGSVPTSLEFTAGKNKIINGDFGVWQRGTSVNLVNNTPTFLADRFACNVNFSAGTASISQQTFTPGTAPVSGYEGQFFHRLNTGTTSTYYEVSTKLEDVRTFAGQTVTISFWAKASSSITIKNLIRQNFGSGGSSSVNDEANFNITTSWVRYSRTLTLGSMSGKTIGTSSFLQIYFYQDSGALGGLTIDLWGLQLEAGSTATSFQTATGTLQGELAACQRYYFRNTGANIYLGSGGIAGSTTQAYVIVKHPTTMRVAPTVLDFSLLRLQIISNSFNLTTAAISDAQPDLTLIIATVASGLTATTQSYMLMAQNNATAHLGLSAEL